MTLKCRPIFPPAPRTRKGPEAPFNASRTPVVGSLRKSSTAAGAQGRGERAVAIGVLIVKGIQSRCAVVVVEADPGGHRLVTEKAFDVEHGELAASRVLVKG